MLKKSHNTSRFILVKRGGKRGWGWMGRGCQVSMPRSKLVALYLQIDLGKKRRWLGGG